MEEKEDFREIFEEIDVNVNEEGKIVVRGLKIRGKVELEERCWFIGGSVGRLSWCCSWSRLLLGSMLLQQLLDRGAHDCQQDLYRGELSDLLAAFAGTCSWVLASFQGKMVDWMKGGCHEGEPGRLGLGGVGWW